MKSPFPGMDPYLESHWGDVHATLLVYARNQLNAQLPDDLQARVEESLAVLQDDETARTVYPDVCVVEETGVAAGDTLAATEVGTRDVAKPYVVRLVDDPTTLRHLEIVDTRDGNRLVTAIEILSPANKVGSTGQLIYIRKQREYLDAKVNLVEIDLSNRLSAGARAAAGRGGRSLGGRVVARSGTTLSGCPGKGGVVCRRLRLGVKRLVG